MITPQDTARALLNAPTQQDAAIQALFSRPQDQLQQMAGDLVPMYGPGQYPMNYGNLTKPGALGLASSGNRAAVMQGKVPYIGPDPQDPAGYNTLQTLRAQDIINRRLNALGRPATTLIPIR